MGSNLKKYKAGTAAGAVKPATGKTPAGNAESDNSVTNKTPAEDNSERRQSSVNSSKTEDAGKPKQAEGKKKIIIAAATAMVLVCILYYSVPAIVGVFSTEEQTIERSYYFYPIYLDENIYADKGYTELDRNYYFEDKSYGSTVSFDPDTLSEIPSEYQLPVSCLVKYIKAAIAGNSENLEELYSVKFYDEGFEAKSGFTAQKIYETKFTVYDSSTVSEDGNQYDCWRFWVEYKIYKNNGTFRNDMGSDCTRKELFVLTYRDGKIEIDGVTPYREA